MLVSNSARLPLVCTACYTGVLALTYMGTDPPTQAVNLGHSGEVDYAALDSEYRQLTSQIQSVKSPVKAAAPEQLLVVTAQVTPIHALLCTAVWYTCATKHVIVLVL